MVDNVAVSWDDYQMNICKGFGAFQQRGEFVDMTLAADGHQVKVHQMVMSMVSPYIKELIISTRSQHPVIFLNGVSFTTMQAILEYAYTGEALVSKDNIGEFLKACKDLHIKGLDNMLKSAQNTLSCMFQIPNTEQSDLQGKSVNDEEDTKVDSDTFVVDNDVAFQDNDDDNWSVRTAMKRKADESVSVPHPDTVTPAAAAALERPGPVSTEQNMAAARLQYCVSAGGNLQVVLNRYLYCLRHVRKNGQRFWRCTNQQASSCPAVLTTHHATIVERVNPHNHAFHDKQIMKRVRAGNLFTSLQDVESAAIRKKHALCEADPVSRAAGDSSEQTALH